MKHTMPSTTGFGVSDTLRSIFEGLSQAQGHYGPKYLDKDIHKVRQYVCCRNYSKATLELVYLCWAVVNAYPAKRHLTAIEAFFWLDEAYTPARFRQAFKANWQGSQGSVTSHDDFLSLQIGNKHFSIAPSRGGVLAVMMEFIVTIDPSLVLSLQHALSTASHKDIEQLASKIQATIYQYLKQHLPEAQVQTRFRYFETWLNQQKIALNNLDDQSILAFWQTASADDSAQSYVLYATALFDVLDAMTAMETVKSQQAIAFAQSFGSDSEANEFNPEKRVASELDDEKGEMLHTLLFADNTDSLLPKTLCQAPKCLTQEEAASLHPLATYQVYLSRFTHAFMRLQVFAKWQSVLVQAKRKSPAALQQKLHDAPQQGYAMYQLEIESIYHAIQYSQDCLLAVLVELEPEFACLEILHKLPPEQQKEVALCWQQNLGQADESWSSRHLRCYLHNNSYRQGVDRLKLALKNNHKAGFKTPAEYTEADQYLANYQLVSQLCKLTQQHLADMLIFSQKNRSLTQLFAADLCIFTDRFNTLYGGNLASQ